MGKGDRRSKRGKMFQGTSGKSRPKGKKKAKPQETAEKKSA
jgi:30S ribosomal protein S31